MRWSAHKAVGIYPDNKNPAVSELIGTKLELSRNKIIVRIALVTRFLKPFIYIYI